MGNKLRD